MPIIRPQVGPSRYTNKTPKGTLCAVYRRAPSVTSPFDTVDGGKPTQSRLVKR